MDFDYNFDAPQFFDFEHPTVYEEAYNDSWFDRHTEDDLPSSNEKSKDWKKSASCGNLGKAQRVLRIATDDSNIAKDAESIGTSQPSPKKRQKMSPKDEENNTNVILKMEHIKSPVKRCAQSPKSLGKSPKKSPRRSPRLAIKSPFKAPKTEHLQAGSPKPGSGRKNNVRLVTKYASTSTLNKSNDKNTPRTLRSHHQSVTNLKGKTTEEMELEKIAEAKRELARQKKQTQKSYNKAMKSDGYVPVRSGQPVTLPQGFHFETDGRLKNQNNPGKETKVKSFTRSLREALPQTESSQSKTLTKPQPFKLSYAKSSSNLSACGKKYESDAEKVIAFHKRTPDRFRSNPSNAKQPAKPLSSSKCPVSGMTIAKTPTLSTKGRSRPVHILTQEEREQMEYEKHQKLQFKAHPLNHKILKKGDVGVPKVPVKALTVPDEFNLHHKASGSMNDLRLNSEDTEQYRFQAKPVNPKILQGTVGVKAVEPLPPTVPQSPAFALKNRVRIPLEVPQVEEPKVTVKANPVPHPGVPFRPRLGHHHTVPEPFSVEERSKRMLTRREEKIQQALEEERKAREFHAKPVAGEKPDLLPPKQERGPTVAEPFHLSSDQRGQRYREEFMAKVQEEERKLREGAQFRAKPSTVTHEKPFIPQKSNRPLTEISEFALNTDTRAVERVAFDNQIKEREAELEGQKRAQEEMKEREELEKQARMRQAAVHKATGIKRYKSMRVEKSDKKLTEAHSPKFSQRSRRHNLSDL